MEGAEAPEEQQGGGGDAAVDPRIPEKLRTLAAVIKRMPKAGKVLCPDCATPTRQEAQAKLLRDFE